MQDYGVALGSDPEDIQPVPAENHLVAFLTVAGKLIENQKFTGGKRSFFVYIPTGQCIVYEATYATHEEPASPAGRAYLTVGNLSWESRISQELHGRWTRR